MHVKRTRDREGEGREGIEAVGGAMLQGHPRRPRDGRQVQRLHPPGPGTPAGGDRVPGRQRRPECQGRAHDFRGQDQQISAFYGRAGEAQAHKA